MSATSHIYFILSAAFILLLFSQIVSAIRKSRNLEDVISGSGNMDALINKNLIGLSVLVPAVVFSVILDTNPHLSFLPSGNADWFIIWFLSLLAALFFGLLLAGERDHETGFYSKFFPAPGRFYLISRSLFLIAYEFFFRGVLFEAIQELTGTGWSILFNVVAYSAVHIYSSKKELIGTAPFGLLLCLLTIKLQSVWPAVSVHLALALSYEVKLIRYQKPVYKSKTFTENYQQ